MGLGIDGQKGEEAKKASAKELRHKVLKDGIMQYLLMNILQN
jgi:hypothetical protein